MYSMPHGRNVLYLLEDYHKITVALRWCHMGAMASQITSLAIVCLNVYSGGDERKHQSSTSLAFCGEFTGEFPAPRSSDAENVSIWWRHEVTYTKPSPFLMFGVVMKAPLQFSLTHWGRVRQLCVFVVVNSDALAQAIERRQVVFLCESRIRTWKSQDTCSPADWLPTHKPTELSLIKLKNLKSTTRPYDEWTFSPLDFTFGFRT